MQPRELRESDSFRLRGKKGKCPDLQGRVSVESEALKNHLRGMTETRQSFTR